MPGRATGVGASASRPARQAARDSALSARDLIAAALLAAPALVLGLSSFPASSLYRDDAWTALVTKTDGLADFLLVSVTAPGFAGLLKGWLGLVGVDEWKAQLLPLAFAVITPPLLYLVLARRGLNRVAAAVGALVLALAPPYVEFATHVKQYSLDALCAVALLWLGWRLLDAVDDVRHWRLLALAGVVALVLSSPSVVFLVSALAVGVVALLRDHRAQARVALLPVVGTAAFTVLWWLLVLRPAKVAGLELYWQGYFVPLDEGAGTAVEAGAVATGRFLGKSTSLVEAAIPLYLLSYGLVLWRRTLLGLLLLAPLAIAFVLAALEVAPLGTGRTDIYLYPALASAVAVAADLGYSIAPRITIVAAALGAAALLVFSSRPAYPEDDVASLVAIVEERASPSDAIVTHPFATYPYALYTRFPVAFEEAETTQTGFRVRARRDNVFLPTEAWPYEGLTFARVVDRVAREHDTVWVVTASTDTPVLGGSRRSGVVASGPGFIRRQSELEVRARLQAVAQAFPAAPPLRRLDDIPERYANLTVQEFADRVMRTNGYRERELVAVTTGAALTRWRR